jgi:transmembrane sensor
MNDYANYTADDFVFDESFGRWVRQQASLAEQRFWTNYPHAHPHQAAALAQARQVLLALNVPEPTLTDAEVANLVAQTTHRLHHVPAEAQVRSLAWYRRPAWRVAAVAVLGVGLGWLAYQNTTWPKPAAPTVTYQQLLETAGPALTEQHNATAQPRQFTLPDGSRVTLLPNSRLSYEQAFSGQNRTVYLTGVADFEVVRNPARPFIVNANETITRVLGTSFRVQAREQDAQVTVEVKTGRVSVSVRDELATDVPDARRDVVLTPNQKAVFSRPDTRLTRSLVAEPLPIAKPTDPEVVAATLPTAFEYTDVPVTEVLHALSSHYGIPIRYDEAALRRCLITVSLTDESFYEKLTVICKATEARYTLTDGEVVVNGKGCE